MKYPAGSLLVADNDTPENLIAVKKFIHDKGLTTEDVSLRRVGKMLEVRAKREVEYR